MRVLILISSFIVSTSALAGLYQCKTPDAKPELIPEGSKQVSFIKSKPFMVEYAKDERAHANKKPFLFYYVVDSEEPFMQLAVKYELAELKKACEKSEHVNFIAFQNSKVSWNRFSYCKNKTFKEVNFDQYPELKEKLRVKRNALWDGDMGASISSPLEFASTFSPEVARTYYDYPMAHPDFLHDLLKFTITTEELFPSSEYIPYINLKSHGSNKSVLSGLQSCQRKAKTDSQNAILEKAFNESERMFLKDGLFTQFLPQLSKLADRIGLGPSVAAHKQPGMGDYSLGDYSLGDYSLGDYSLGDIFSGLGSSEGLSTKFSFGLTHAGLSTVINRLFNEKNERFIGFVMLESCDTNRKVQIHQQHLPFVLGMYSAKNSLWYRNLNWWTILEDAGGSSLKLIELLEFHTEQIDNIVVKDI